MTVYIGLGTPTIDNSRKILTVPITTATGALTIGATPHISATVGGVAAAIGTLSTTGSGATANLIVPLTNVAPVGQAITVTAATSSIVDASNHTMTDGTVTATDPDTANQSALQALVQAGLNNYGFGAQLRNGMFGKVTTPSPGVYYVYAKDNVTPIAEVHGSVDNANVLTVTSWRQLPAQ